MATDEFFILSLKWTRGSPVTWWRPGAAGYTTDLQNAGRYSRQQVEANREYYDNKTDTLAVPCSDAMLMATTRVSVEIGRDGLKQLREARKRAFRKPRSTPAPSDHAGRRGGTGDE
jgi:hypothetical protein